MTCSKTVVQTLLARPAFGALVLFAAIANSSFGAEAEAALEWHRVSASDASGKGWPDTAKPFDRLPGRAESIVRPEVWELARHSAGLYVDIVTNADAILRAGQ